MGYFLNDSSDRFPHRQPEQTPPDGSSSGGLIDGLHSMFLDLGFQSERRGEPHAALELYKRAVATNPESALAWYNYGDVFLTLDQPAKALEPLSKAIALAPDVPLFHYDLGLALYRLQRYEEAAREFAPIVDADPELKRASSTLGLGAMTNLALIQDAASNPARGFDILKPSESTACNILYNLGHLSLRARRPGEAGRFFLAASLLAPNDEAIAHGTGRCYLQLRDHAQAMPFLRRATKLDPQCASAWYDLGLTLSGLNRRKQARACFRKSRSLDPRNPWPHYGLACLDALDGKPQAAFRALAKAVANGFTDLRHLRRDPDLRSLRKDKRWKALLASIAEPMGQKADD